MSVDWDDDAVTCGAAAAAKKKLKKSDGLVKQHHEELQPANPELFPSALLSIPQSRRSKKVKRLKPEKWKAAFDCEGRPVGFHKLLKVIRKGGVDRSIRAEVWEFLLGCYELGTTSAYRDLIRQARRERYRELLEQCRIMHSSVGTGALAYTVGSKLMDVRVISKEGARKAAPLVAQAVVGNAVAASGVVDVLEDRTNGLSSVRATPQPASAGSRDFDKGPAPVDRIAPFDADCNGIAAGATIAESSSSRRSFDDDDESQSSSTCGTTGGADSPANMQQLGASGSFDSPRTQRQELLPGQVGSPEPAELGPRLPGEGLAPKLPLATTEPEKDTASFVGSAAAAPQDPEQGPGVSVDEERVADWLWTLHRIVVDVVRTDKHLEFYRDGKNSARMSDILAVYAWVDPATGYCQGMSDLLSPFIVLFDNDADAFWCFESLLKRVRHNFQMEGPVGVMKQLEALSKILELTDAQMLKHLVLTGADNFLFAFRMLLVLFRRELSFAEALYMWEMMWAADFEQVSVWALEYQCLEALRLRDPFLPDRGFPPEEEACGVYSLEPLSPSPSLERLHASGSPGFDALRWKALAKRSSFCGLRPGRMWRKHQNRMFTANAGLLGRNGDEDISVFCVAAIIEQNRNMLLEKLQSMDDAVKIFNDMEIKMKVHSCVNTAVKLRKRYRTQSSKRVVLERRSSAPHPQRFYLGLPS